MAKNDVRSLVINKLEVFAEQYNLKFLWSIERRPDGCMTVHFKRKADNFEYTYRVTSNDIISAKGDPDVIIDKIIKLVTEAL